MADGKFAHENGLGLVKNRYFVVIVHCVYRHLAVDLLRKTQEHSLAASLLAVYPVMHLDGASI